MLHTDSTSCLDHEVIVAAILADAPRQRNMMLALLDILPLSVYTLLTGTSCPQETGQSAGAGPPDEGLPPSCELMFMTVLSNYSDVVNRLLSLVMVTVHTKI